MSYSRILELIRASKGGNNDATDELLRTYDKLIKKYVNRYFFKGHDNEDLEQIARLAAIKAISKYNENNGANFTGFLEVVLRNTFSIMVKKKENIVYTVSLNQVMLDDEQHVHEYIDIIEDSRNHEEDFIEKEYRLRLREVLNTLPKEERELLIIAYSGHGRLKEYSLKKGITYRQAIYARDKVFNKVKKIMVRLQ